MKFYSFCKTALSSILKSLFRVRVIGNENEPENGTLLLCSNHISMWDPLLIAVSLKNRQVRYMGKAELFKIPLLGLVLRTLGAFPVDRNGGDTAAIRKCIELLRSGECVGIFPQGTRHAGVDARNTEVKGGTGMCAYRGKSDILPVSIVTKSARIKPFKKTYIIIGEVIKYEDLGINEGDKEEFLGASQLIHERICDLIDQYKTQL